MFCVGRAAFPAAHRAEGAAAGPRSTCAAARSAAGADAHRSSLRPRAPFFINVSEQHRTAIKSLISILDTQFSVYNGDLHTTDTVYIWAFGILCSVLKWRGLRGVPERTLIARACVHGLPGSERGLGRIASSAASREVCGTQVAPRCVRGAQAFVGYLSDTQFGQTENLLNSESEA